MSPLPTLLSILRAARAADALLTTATLDQMIALAEKATVELHRAHKALDEIVGDAIEDAHNAEWLRAERRPRLPPELVVIRGGLIP